MYELQEQLRYPDSLIVEYPVIQKGMNLNPREYADGEKFLDRVQIRFSDQDFGLMVRHPVGQHWCSYLLVPESEWDQSWREHLPSPVSFVGPPTSHICWMYPTNKLKLSVPGSVLQGGLDFWIGTDYELTRASANTVYQMLVKQNESMRKLRNANSAVRGQAGNHGELFSDLEQHAHGSGAGLKAVHPSQYLARKGNPA